LSALRVESSSINIERGLQLRYGAPLQLQHRARTASPSSLGAYSSSINIERGPQLRYGTPLQLQHHQARTAVLTESSADSSSGMGRHSSSSITERAQQLRPNIWGSENMPAIGYKLLTTTSLGQSPKFTRAVCGGFLRPTFFSESFCVLLQLPAGFLVPFSCAVETS